MDKISLPQISDFAVTSNLVDYAGDHIDTVTFAITSLGDNINTVKSSIVNKYNNLDAALNILEFGVKELSSKVSNVIYNQANEITDFVWVSDTFATRDNTDKATTALVNTDRGLLTLTPTSYLSVTSFTPTLNEEVMKKTKTFPGCNLLALRVTPGGENTEPKAEFDTNDSSNLLHLFDNKETTHFEVERNFIYSKQKAKQSGKAYVSDISGSEIDVLNVTNNFDWNVNLYWPEALQLDEGADKKGYSIAEFIQPIASSEVRVNLSSSAEFAVTLTMNEPMTLSGVRLDPFIRHKKNVSKVKLATVKLEGLEKPVTIAKEFVLNPGETTATKFNLFETKISSSGKFIPINSSRRVESVFLHFEGSASEDVLFGHPFVWVNVHRRSERNYGLFKSVDHEDIPKRVELFAKTRPTVATQKTENITPTFDPEKGSYPAEGAVIGSENKGTILSGLAPIATQAASQISVANPYMQFLINLGVGSGLVENLISIGSFNRTFTVTDQRQGYDLFNGYRSTVAIKTIALEKVQYSSAGVYVSKVLKFGKAVNRVALVSEFHVPTDWGTQGWVTYSFSIDNGATWQSIEPSKGGDFDNSVKLDKQINSIMMKIEIKGNASDLHQTPSVAYYALKGFKE